jgi:hypothetical protein
MWGCRFLGGHGVFETHFIVNTIEPSTRPGRNACIVPAGTRQIIITNDYQNFIKSAFPFLQFILTHFQLFSPHFQLETPQNKFISPHLLIVNTPKKAGNDPFPAFFTLFSAENTPFSCENHPK